MGDAEFVAEIRPDAARAISNTVAFGDFSQVARAWFNRPLLRFAVYGYQPKFRAVAFEPLEIVQKRPMNVAADIDSVRQAFPDAGESLVDVVDAAGIVFRADTVFRNVDGNLGFLIRVADGLFEGFG